MNGFYRVFSFFIPEPFHIFGDRLQEDQLSGIKLGQKLTGEIPALAKSAEFRVSWMSAMGDFATWRSTGEKGSFDLRTFEVRARPAAPEAELRPGMTARFTPAPPARAAR